LFYFLAADPSPLVPDSRDIADQRRKYGVSILRRGDGHVATHWQKGFEVEAQAKLDAARQRRK
jgi:RNA polymerase-associated protein CTR9